MVHVLIGRNVFIIKSRQDKFCVKLFADNVWESENHKTGFFSVGVGSFNRLLWEMINFLAHGAK